GVLRVTVRTEYGEHTAEGACFGDDPRVVALDGYAYNIVPQGHLLVWWNYDRPGVIGSVGTLLGEAGVNIAGMQLGRDAEGGRAISIVAVDAPVAETLLEQIATLPGMLDARRVDFGDAGKAVLPVPSA